MKQPKNIDQEKLKQIFQYWKKFYAQLEIWIGKEAIENLQKSTQFNPIELNYVEFDKCLRKLQNIAVKVYISSSHSWIPGKQRYSGKTDNWYQPPLECSICKLQATDWDNADCVEAEKTSSVPSRDMHNQFITRTCQEVLADKEIARKKRKGGKCITCNTYNCISKST